MRFILPSLNLRMERWKWNEKHRVYVSTLGHFKDEYKQNLPIKIDHGGYVRVKTNVSATYPAHRLVMLTWRPIASSKNLTVDHLNHNKRDNSLLNLEWVSGEENQRRAKEDQVSTSLINQQFLTWPQIKNLIKNKDWASLAKCWKDNRISIILEDGSEIYPKDKNSLLCYSNVPNNFNFIRTIVETNGNCYNRHFTIKVKEERK